MTRMLFQVGVVLAVSSLARAQALSGTLEDLDPPTLKALRERSGCSAPRDAATGWVCKGLASFERGAPLNAKLIAGKRLVGAGAAVTAAGAVSAKLELLAFLFQQAGNFHAAVELGDSATAVPVTAENAEEAAAAADAAAALSQGKVPTGNGAFEYARTMKVDDKLVHTRLTTGKSVGLEGKNRTLLRQDGRTVVLIELPFLNSHVPGHPYWINVFQVP